MGYDTSYHPIDAEIVGALVDVVSDREPLHALDDLLRDAARVAHVRYRANAWGLAATRTAEARAGDFDAWRYVWGRPFLITVEGTTAIADAIDAYLRGSVDDAEHLAREMLDHVSPGLSSRVVPPDPDEEFDALPHAHDMIKALRHPVMMLRLAYQHLGTPYPVRLPDGDTADPAALLRESAVFEIVELAAGLRPGWMDRGHVWPSWLLMEADCFSAALDLFEPAHTLLGPLAELDIGWPLEGSIAGNYSVGGYVPAARVGELRALLERERDALLAVHDGEAEGSYRKLLEAVRDAEHRGMAFAEATEIYSGMEGRMN